MASPQMLQGPSLKTGWAIFLRRIMSRSKPRNTDLIHDLQRENKELKETIRKFERQANNEAKKEKKSSKAQAKVEEAKPKDPAACEQCQNGKIQIVELGARKMLVCSLVCGFRKVIKV